jgi:hypothetical protein
LNAQQHSPTGQRDDSDASSVLSPSVYSLILSPCNLILSYYDNHKAKRFHWQEAFASSKYRFSFSFAECERTNSSHLSRLMALAGLGGAKTFTQTIINNQMEELPIGA